MTYQGTVKNGMVVFEAGAPPPEGTRVRVEVEQQSQEESLSELLLRFAGCATDLPADFAAEHDHYIHGTPKRSEQSPE